MPYEGDSKETHPKKISSWRVSLAFLVLVLGFSITLSSWYVADTHVKDQLGSEQDVEFIKLKDSFQSEILGYQYSLVGIKGLFSASNEVDREEFNTYLDSLDVAKHFPGVYTYAYVSKISHDKAPEFLANLKNEVEDEFVQFDDSYFALPEANDHYFLNYIYKNPVIVTPLSFGFDLGGSPERRKTLESAMESGLPTASSPIKLRSVDEQGFILTIPIFQNDMPINTQQERRDALVGFVNATVSYEYLFNRIFEPYRKRDREIKIWDSGQLVFDTSQNGNRSGKMLVSSPDNAIHVAGRKWQVDLLLEDGINISDLQKRYPLMILALGASLTLILFGLVYMSFYSEKKAQEEVSIVTKKLLESKNSLANAQRIAHLGNWDLDISTNKLVWSDEMYRIIGLKPQEFATTHEEFLKFVHPEDKGVVKNAVERAIKENKLYNIRHRVIQPTGNIRYVYEQGEVKYNGKKAVKMTGTVLDITDLIVKEQKLEKLTNLMVGRELKMIDMKKEMEILKTKLK